MPSESKDGEKKPWRVVMWAIHVEDVHRVLAEEFELRENGSQSRLP